MLHSWYDPQRVLKEHPGTRSRRQNQAASFLVRPAEGIERLDIDAVTEQDGWLHSWYDPQRVLKVLSLQSINVGLQRASFLVRPAEGIESFKF